MGRARPLLRPEKTRRCRPGTRSPGKPAIPRSGVLRRQFRPAGAVGRICPRADHLRTYALQQRGDSFASSDRAHRRSCLRRFLGGAGLSGRHSARIQTLRGAGTPVPLALRRRSRTRTSFQRLSARYVAMRGFAPRIGAARQCLGLGPAVARRVFRGRGPHVPPDETLRVRRSPCARSRSMRIFRYGRESADCRPSLDQGQSDGSSVPLHSPLGTGYDPCGVALRGDPDAAGRSLTRKKTVPKDGPVRPEIADDYFPAGISGA